MININEKIKDEYKDFLKSFGISISDEEIEQRINRNPYGTRKQEEELSEIKKEAIQLYTQVCEDFDLPFNKKIYKKSTSEIWDKAIRLVDLQIKERFGDLLSQIINKYQHKHVRETIAALFDQRIYIDRDKVEILISVKEDQDELYKKYLDFGGDKKVLNFTIYDDDELDECEDDEEDYIIDDDDWDD